MVSFSRAFVLALVSAYTLLSSVQAQITPVYNSANYLIEITDAPALVPFTNPVNLTARDDVVDYIPLPFNFVFYNRSYSSVNSSANGNVQFRTAATGYANTLFGQNANTYAPIIAAFFTDLYPNAAGQRTYQISGTAPNRQLTIRFTDVNYCCVAYSAGRGLSFDIVLTETTNTVDVRYYRLLAGTRSVEIGVEGSGDNTRWAYIWNDVPFTEANLTLLQGKNVRYVPVNQAPGGSPPEPITITPIYNSREYEVVISDAPTRPVLAGETNFPAVDDAVHYVPLPFNFVFYNRSYYSVNASTNGNVQFNTVATGSTGSLFGPTGTNSYAPVIAAFFADLYPTTLGQRTWVVTGQSPNRALYLRFYDVGYCCVAGGGGQGLEMDIVLYETSHAIDIRYYRVPISITTTRSVEIGVQNSGSGNARWVSVWNDAAFNDESAAGFAGKNIRFNPVNQDPNGVPPAPIVITPVYNSPSYTATVTAAPTFAPIAGMTNLTGADDGNHPAPIGFDFVFYNATYNVANVGTNVTFNSLLQLLVIPAAYLVKLLQPLLFQSLLHSSLICIQPLLVNASISLKVKHQIVNSFFVLRM